MSRDGNCGVRSQEEEQTLLGGVPHSADMVNKPRSYHILSKLAVCSVLLAMGLFCVIFLDGEKVRQIVPWLTTHQRKVP